MEEGYHASIRFQEMKTPEYPIQKFAGHIAVMRSFVNYIVTMMRTFPLVMTKLDATQRGEIIEPCVTKWSNYVKELYELPDLYKNPLDPLPVDQKCTGSALSDQIKERLGRNHPFFDFVNAPFTHPLGTQISLICINYSWDAYDTFIKEQLSFLANTCAEDHRVSALNEAARNPAGKTLSTNEKLTLLGVLPTDDEVADVVKQNYSRQSDLKPEQARLTLQVAKELRNCFAHRFGKPSPKLILIIESADFDDFPIRLTNDGYEVQLMLSRMIAEVIQVTAYLINEKADKNFGLYFKIEKK